MTVDVPCATGVNAGLPGVSVRRFGGAAGTEYYLAVAARVDLPFAEQLSQVEHRYAEALRVLGLSAHSAVFRRVFLSDAANQASLLSDSPVAKDGMGGPVAVSVIQQPPLPGGKIVLLAYHLACADPLSKARLSPSQVLVCKQGRRHLWTTRLCSEGSGGSGDAATQTAMAFGALDKALGQQGANLRDHCVRTWIYVKDVDLFYQDVVRSRMALFLRHGLTADTHYIASTGIEGACAHQYDLVVLDAYSLPDLHFDQMSFLNDFDHMCATKNYNVTFERGTRIAYADRAHYFISGTASIDRRGAILFPGDVVAQLERALLNVQSILCPCGASLDDMMYWIVYLRDSSDYNRAASLMALRCPNVPTVFVRAPVCRPGWLIEVEGVAISALARPDLPDF